MRAAPLRRRRSPTRLRRLGAISAAALIAMWLAVLITGYWGESWTTRSYEPSPDRVAAIVALTDSTPEAERPALFDALDSPVFRVSQLPPDQGGIRRADEALMRHYMVALAGYAFTATRDLSRALDTDPHHFNWQLRRVIRIQVGLSHGDRLLIEATSPTILTGFGLPVGVLAGAVGTVISLIALWTLWREIGPLTQLARATEKLDLSGRPMPLPDTRGQSHEITALAEALTRLQQRLSSVLSTRMALVGGISHDVRTFATRLRLRVEGIPDPEHRAKAIRDIADMIRLLDDALLAVRSGTAQGGEELVNFGALVTDEVADLARQHLPVTLSVPVALLVEEMDIEVLGDPLALRRIVLNLLSNALRYGHRAEVRLSVDPQAGTVTLAVADDGPGIAPELRESLQEPFTRSEGSRNRGTGGSGLGLAIARSLAEGHGGRLSLDPGTNDGATVAVILPLFRRRNPQRRDRNGG